MTTSAPPSKPRKKRSVAPKHETIVRAFKFAMDVPEAKSGQLFEANIVQAIAFGTVNDPSLRACTLLGRGLEGVI